MSCYEWEEGRFQLSVAEYSKFKKAFLTGVNGLYQSAYADALKLHQRILDAAKGKRTKSWFQLFHQHRQVENRGVYGVSTYTDLDEMDIAFGSMFRKFTEKDKWGTSRRIDCRPLKPRKGDFAVKKQQKNPRFRFEEASVEFNDKARVVMWRVEENNHSCDRAAEHKMGKLFFRLLGNVNRTRGTGGTIVGNDEYNRDSYEAGGGGNYIKTAYGPRGKEEQRFAFSF